MFCHFNAKKKLKGNRYPFPKNQSPKDAELVKNIKITNIFFFKIRIALFKINMLFTRAKWRHGLIS